MRRPTYAQNADNWGGAACSIETIFLVIDTTFTALFTFEMVLKMLALGFLIPTATAYLANGWNQLDFAVVCVSLVSLVPRITSGSSSSALNSLKTLRSLRALRPLRMISRSTRRH